MKYVSLPVLYYVFFSWFIFCKAVLPVWRTISLLMPWTHFFPCLMLVLQIDLMISGNQPVKAIAYISELQLFWAVFALPSEIEPSISDGCDRFIAFVAPHFPSNEVSLHFILTFKH